MDDATIRPVRLRRKRVKGFSLQRLSLEVNGLPVVDCTRPGKWGNPYRIGDYPGGDRRRKAMDALDVVEAYRDRECGFTRSAEIARELRGRNLGCWCALCPKHARGKPFDVVCVDCAPCHADVLGRAATRFACEPVEPAHD